MNAKWIILLILAVALLALTGWLVLRRKDGHTITVPEGAKVGDLSLEPCRHKVDGLQ